MQDDWICCCKMLNQIVDYEVEIQLGKTDESHIIRTIEYWDIERKRYPQYDHTAVIVAENVTSRFLNVINLFNGVIPLMAIQMNAVKMGNQIGLAFTTVLDQVLLGLVDEDEEVQEATDRSYWEKRGTPTTVKMADNLLELIHSFDQDFELKYNKFYIGLAKNGQPNNFALFRPRKNHLGISIRLPRTGEIEGKLEDAGLALLEYSSRYGGYRIQIKAGEEKKHAELLSDLLAQSYKETES